MAEEKDYHFFATSALGWNTGEDIVKVLALRKREDRPKMGLKATGCRLFKVLLPAKAHYKINEYIPVVPKEKLIFIDRITY